MRKFSTLALRGARAMPETTRVAVPLAIMAALYWLSSIPGTPLAEDPDAYALFRWVAPEVQNVLHIPAYAVLSWAWHWSLADRLRPAGTRAIVAFAIASVYGLLDEWHQSFVPGRFASLTDVALDVAGALLGAWIVWRKSRRAPAPGGR